MNTLPNHRVCRCRIGHGGKIPHEKWRWFDWLWMLLVMDYGRDHIGNWLLRAFSVLWFC
ncbi:MAG: hypothetical protein IPL27_09570 [Lewinellaceae bacterium]|nr:hypothetical protein [Lewinellaceae bacterium]